MSSGLFLPSGNEAGGNVPLRIVAPLRCRGLVDLLANKRKQTEAGDAADGQYGWVRMSTDKYGAIPAAAGGCKRAGVCSPWRNVGQVGLVGHVRPGQPWNALKTLADCPIKPRHRSGATADVAISHRSSRDNGAARQSEAARCRPPPGCRGDDVSPPAKKHPQNKPKKTDGI